MKKMILSLAFSAGVLFGAESSSSSHAPDPGYNLPETPFPSITDQQFKDMNPGYSEVPWEKIEEAFKSGPHIFIARQPDYQVQHHTYGPQIIRHEKGNLLEQAAETAVHVSTQTLFTMLMQDMYHGIKNILIANDEEVFQKSVTKLKLQQAQNAEKERELNIEAGRANLEIMKEISALITTTRELTALATQRSLTAAEQTQLNSANHALAMLKGLMNASAA